MAKKSLILTADIKDFNMCFLELVDDNIVVNEKKECTPATHTMYH